MSEEIKNGNVRNIDSLLTQTSEVSEPKQVEKVETTSNSEVSKSEDAQKVEKVAAVEPKTSETATKATESASDESSSSSADDSTDEYGSPVTKTEKVYTEAEVQAMIRDRLSRVKSQQPETANKPAQEQQQQQATGDESNWQAELESFIGETLTKRERQLQEQAWRKQQEDVQAQFEVKFNQGASKYADFDTVVHGKPLTPEMVLATRSMNDPAAFIYAASKTQAKELERISKIQDGFTQAVEIGQLAERMRKSRSSVSQAPRPVSTPSGDVSEGKERSRSIDDKLRDVELRMRKERVSR